MLEKYLKYYPIFAGICVAVGVTCYGKTLMEGYYKEGYKNGNELGKIEGMLELTKVVVKPEK